MNRFEDFAPTERLAAASLSPCGSVVASVNGAGGNFNLFLEPLDGESRQLTSFMNSTVRQVVWRPCGTMIAFTADDNGDENHQIFLVDITTGELTKITSSQNSQHWLSDGCWSPDGSQLAYASDVADELIMAPWLYSIAADKHRQLANFTGFTSGGSWCADGRYLGFTLALNNTTAGVYIVDTETDTICGPSDPQDAYTSMVQPTGPNTAHVITTINGEFPAVATFDVDSGCSETIFAPAWSVNQAHFVDSGSKLLALVNEDGYSVLQIVDPSTGHVVATPNIPAGTAPSLSAAADGNTVLLTVNSPTLLANRHLINVSDNSATQLTANRPRTVDVAELIAPELVRIPSPRGHNIPLFLYRPQGDGPFPVVVSVHGGPQAQETARYVPLYQLLLSHGIGIVAPNIAGSSGYGKTYKRMIQKNWGDVDLIDLACVRSYCAELPWSDETKIGVFGGSYGGFAVLSCLSRQPQDWACGVDLFGPSNLVSLCKTSPASWRSMLKEFIGDWEDNPEDLLQRSPITYADNIVAPLMVVQGGTDPRVVRAESDNMVHALRARGVAVRYDVYPDEGHGFTRETNEWQAFNDTTDFLVQHLITAH